MELTRRKIITSASVRRCRRCRTFCGQIALVCVQNECADPGPGISRPNTALLLEEQELLVRILEARNRVASRILTLFDQPGDPEMGFNSMAARDCHRTGLAKVVLSLSPRPSTQRQKPSGVL
jgi:hypothetical protein